LSKIITAIEMNDVDLGRHPPNMDALFDPERSKALTLAEIKSMQRNMDPRRQVSSLTTDKFETRQLIELFPNRDSKNTKVNRTVPSQPSA
jgi:hypothetical protein